MAGYYNTYKVFTPGEVLTAADLNASEQQHVTNQVSWTTEGYSRNLTESRVQVASSTLSLTVADELARLREKIRLLGGVQYWDQVAGPPTLGIMPKAQILLPLEGATTSDNSAGGYNSVPTSVQRVSQGTPPGVAPKVVETVWEFHPTTPMSLMWKIVTPLGYNPGGLIELVAKVSIKNGVAAGNIRILAGIAPVIDNASGVYWNTATASMWGPDNIPCPAAWTQKEIRVSVPTSGVVENQKCVVILMFYPASTSNCAEWRVLEACTVEFYRGNYLVQNPGMPNPMIQAGDMIIGYTSGTPVRLANSSDGQILTMLGGLPSWQNPPGGMTNPMVAAGDIIVGVGAGVPTRLPIGASGHVLTSGIGSLVWQAPPGFNNPMTGLGDLIRGDVGGTAARLAPGTNGHVLTMAAGVPTWQTLPVDPGFANPMSGIGDLIRGDTSGVPVRLAPGANGTWLTLIGGIPTWSTLPVDPGFANPMTTVGDIIRATAAGAPQRLGIGSTNQVLTVIGGVPTWQTLPIDPGFANPMTAVGDLIRGGASGTPTRLAPGTNGHFLTLTAGIPTWAALPVDPGFANPMTTQWDLIVGGAGGTPARFAKGADTQVLTMVAGALSWAAPASGGMTNPMTGVGDIIRGGTSGAPTRLAPGTNGHVLTLSSGVPTWLAAPSGGGVTWPLLAPDGTAAAPSYGFATTSNSGMYLAGGNLALSAAGTTSVYITTAGLSALRLDIGTIGDTLLARDGPGILAQKNGANAQHFRLYEDETTGKYLQITTGPGYHAIASHSPGPLVISSDIAFYFAAPLGSNRWVMDTFGGFYPASDNVYDLGASSNHVRDFYLSRNLWMGAASIKPVDLLGDGAHGGVEILDQKGGHYYFAPVMDTSADFRITSPDTTKYFSFTAANAYLAATATHTFAISAGSAAFYFNVAKSFHAATDGDHDLGFDSVRWRTLYLASNMNFKALASAPTTPVAGSVGLYAKTDKKLYFKDDAGLESLVLTGASATIAYSTSMTPDAALGNVQIITATNATAFTINAPTNPTTNQQMTIMIRNTSGGALGTATWNAVFKMGAAWVQPATTKSRSIIFRYDGTNWIELMRGAADVSN
jgi:hypothetical protein